MTSTTPLRAGVVGLGFAGEVHLKGYRECGAEPVVLAGLEPDRRAQLGERYGVGSLVGPWEDVVARSDIDVVSVCAPNHLHAPIAIAALESGKHVLCEKPLARSAKEAQAMVDAAVANDRVLHTSFNHRERGDVAFLRDHIRAGGLGRIYHAKASWMRRRGVPGRGGWFTSKEMAGGGPLIDLGVHVLDLALHLLDEPEVLSVTAATYAELAGKPEFANTKVPTSGGDGGFEVEDLATAFVRLGGGVTLLLEASWATYGSAGDDFGVTLFGTEGGAEMRVRSYATHGTLELYSDVHGVPSVVRPATGAGEGHTAVVRAFLAAIASGDFSTHRGTQGLQRTTVVDACYASAEAGREVLL